MSYIHDALRKAQKEKESLTGKCASIWSARRSGKALFSKGSLVSISMIAVAFAFSALSWFSSMGELASETPGDPMVHRGKVTSSVPGPTFSGRSTMARAPEPGPLQQGETRPERPVQGPATPPGARPEAQRPAPLPSTQREGQPPGRPATAEPQVPPSRPVSQPPLVSQQTATPTPAQGPSAPASAANGLYTQAISLQKQGRLDEAKRLYEAALNVSPNLVSALNNLGAIYIQQNNQVEARKVLEKAVRVDPGYADAYYNLACLHARQNDLTRGLFYLKKAVSLNETARQWAKTDADLQNLRNHPEYEELFKGASES